MDLISIIVPVYNAEKYLNRCIESVLNQTYQNIELILINDGSTDNSLNICLEYANTDNRIVVVNQENLGVAVARNKGIDEATGEYIMFLDSDDWYDANYVLYLYQSIIKADLSIGSLLKVFDNGETSYIRINEIDVNRFCWPILEGLYISCYRCIFKTEIIKQNYIKFTPNCRTGEDQEFTFKYMIHTKNITFNDDAVYNYYINQNSVMQQLDYRHFDAVDAMLRVVNYADQYNDERINVIKNTLLHFYIPRILEFSILTVLNGNETPKKILNYLKETKYYNLLKNACIQKEYYKSNFLKQWKKSPKCCLKKYYFRKKVGKFIRRFGVKL